MRYFLLLTLVIFSFYACAPGNAIETKKISFDSSALKLEPIDREALGIKTGTRYVLAVEGVNDAFNDIKYNVKRTSKSLNVPAVIAPYLPLQITPVNPRHMSLVTVTGGPLAVLEAEATQLTDYLNHVAPCVKILENNVSNPTATIGISDSCATVALIAIGHAGGDLNLLIPPLLNDFKLRFQLAKDNSDIPDDDDGAQLYKDAALFAKNESIMLKFPAILAAFHDVHHIISSKPLTVGKDDFLDVTFTVRGHKYAEQTDTILTRAIRFYRVNYISVDVTAGLFGSNLFSPSYHFVDSMGHVVKESKSKLDLSIGGLFHTYYVWTPTFKIGACAGVGISVLDAKPKFLVGPSLVVGRSKEFSISGGWAFASLPVPSNAVGSNFVSSVETAVPTYNKVVTGFFIGLTYNIIASH